MRFYLLIRPNLYITHITIQLVNTHYHFYKFRKRPPQIPIKTKKEWMYRAAKKLLFQPVYIEAKISPDKQWGHNHIPNTL